MWNAKVIRSAAGIHFRLPISSNVEWDDIEKQIPDDSQIILADNRTLCDDNSADSSIVENQDGDEYVSDEDSDENDDSSSDDEDESSVKKNSLCRSDNIDDYNLPLLNYNDVNYSNNSIVIIIGGESYGISEDAYKFGERRKGLRVTIPLLNNVDSLNSSVALGILSFEAKKNLSIELPKEKNNNLRVSFTDQGMRNTSRR